MAQPRDDELARLKGFAIRVLEHIQASAVMDERMEHVLHDALTSISASTSLPGVRQAASDVVEWSQDIRGESLARLDAALAELSLPTVTLMRSKANRRFTRILVRGRIRSEDEYRLVNARAADMARELADSDRALAERLLAAFRR